MVIIIKKLSLIMAVIMAALVIALPASATGASSTFTPGEIIYCENFSNVPDTDDLSVIEASLGYKVVAVDTSTLDYTMTEKNISAAIKYSVKDGKLCVDNTADDCAYSYLYIYDSDSMKDLVKTTYTVQYEITYVAGPTAYCSPILNWDGEFTHQVPMFRGNGTYRNQVRYITSDKKTQWKDWDGMSDTWLPSPIWESDTSLIQNVTVRLVSVPDKGIYIYANQYLVSAPSDIASAKSDLMPGALTGTALGLRSQKGASVVIDNIAIYAGDGSKITPDFSAYGFKGLDPVVETTEAETTAAPVTSKPTTTKANTTKAPEPATKAPDVTTKSPETTAPETKKGCGSSAAVGFVILAALVPAAVITRKKK